MVNKIQERFIQDAYNRINPIMMFQANNKENREKAKELFEIILRYTVSDIICDETNNPPSLVDSGKMCVRIVKSNRDNSYDYVDLFLGQ